jgi:hypothetical protein
MQDDMKDDLSKQHIEKRQNTESMASIGVTGFDMLRQVSPSKSPTARGTAMKMRKRSSFWLVVWKFGTFF